jgi:geranylgeranyl reductase family protein
VIVVGGGPAGAATAALLARDGFDVLLLDRARFPRDKPCGEFLTPETERVLSDLGVWKSVLSAGMSPIDSVLLRSPSGKEARYMPSDGVAGWSILRRDLDAALLIHAKTRGAEVREGTSVRGILRRADKCLGVRLDGEEITARLVIGADGTHSMVARELGLVRPLPRLQRLAIVTHWRGLQDEPVIELRANGRTVCGIGSLAGALSNLTMVVPTDDAKNIAGRSADFVRERIAAAFPDLKDRVASSTLEPDVKSIGCFGHHCRRAHAHGAMLVGDAATFVDPFTGEGVYFALRGAELAAHVSRGALHANDVSAARLSVYDNLRAELRARYWLCGLVQAVVRNRRLMDRAIAALNAKPQTTERLMEALGDRRPARDALRLRTAWDLFGAVA